MIKTFLILIFVSSSVIAAIPKQNTSLEKILAKQTSEKFNELKKQGPEVYAKLKNIAFNNDKHLAMRWQAFMAMVRLGEKESLPEIQQALESKDWFLKNAALRVAVHFDESLAYKAAVKNLADNALVVRSEAVKALAKIKKPESSDKLWEELYSKSNYMKNQSLWIRKDIITALSEFSPKGTEEKFIKVLSDSDSTLFGPAIQGLERLTGFKLGDKDMPPVYKRYLWKKWFETNSKKEVI